MAGPGEASDYLQIFYFLERREVEGIKPFFQENWYSSCYKEKCKAVNTAA